MSLDQPAGGDPGKLRISDAERHRAADFLRDAAAEGRLDVDELDERLEATYAAKTYDDLLPVLVDLPGTDGSPLVRPRGAEPASRATGAGSPSVPATRHDLSVAVMSGQDRRGVWEVGPGHQAVAVMGGVTLDLRRARFASAEVVITAVALMGGIDVVVGAGQRVSVEGFGLMGGFDEARPQVDADLGPDSPLVRVRGVAIMGGVTVTRKADPGTPRRLRRGGH
ncbi:DUF1707 domain-containing protein [Nocardioides lentus]|uniref:DUF1707 domain-containing protein n=1 Tax=Nocardioides lentus TaxID=338077 RepID=A0ABP5AQY3_9ACTN